MLGFTLINVSKGSPRGSKSAVYQSRSDDATTVFIASGNNPSWDVFLGLHDCSLSPTRLLTHKQLGISSQNVILFSNIISYILNISVWIRSNSVSIYCQHCGYFRTRASVGRRLSSHPCASCCLWVKTFGDRLVAALAPRPIFSWLKFTPVPYNTATLNRIEFSKSGIFIFACKLLEIH